MGRGERVKDFRNVRGPEVPSLYQKCGLEATNSDGVGEAESEHKRCTMAGSKVIWRDPAWCSLPRASTHAGEFLSQVGVTMHGSTSAKVLALQGESKAQRLEELALSASHFNPIAAKSVRPSSQMPPPLSPPRTGLV